MALVQSVSAANAVGSRIIPRDIAISGGNLRIVVISAVGEVSDTAWEKATLTPKEVTVDTVKLDFTTERSNKVGIQLKSKLHGYCGQLVPDTVKKVVIRSESGDTQINISDYQRRPGTGGRNQILNQHLGAYEDSQQIDYIDWSGIYMKKLRHDFYLKIDGPDNMEDQVDKCLREAVAAGVIAAVTAAIATGGLLLGPAINAAIAQLLNCLGNRYAVSIPDEQHWIYWKV